jgi:hypothetical protein
MVDGWRRGRRLDSGRTVRGPTGRVARCARRRELNSELTGQGRRHRSRGASWPTDAARPGIARSANARSTDARSTDARSTDAARPADIRSGNARSTNAARPGNARSTDARSTDAARPGNSGSANARSTDAARPGNSRPGNSRSGNSRSANAASTDAARPGNSRSVNARSTDAARPGNARSTDARSTNARSTDAARSGNAWSADIRSANARSTNAARSANTANARNAHAGCPGHAVRAGIGRTSGAPLELRGQRLRGELQRSHANGKLSVEQIGLLVTGVADHFVDRTDDLTRPIQHSLHQLALNRMVRLRTSFVGLFQRGARV